MSRVQIMSLCFVVAEDGLKPQRSRGRGGVRVRPSLLRLYAWPSGLLGGFGEEGHLDPGYCFCYCCYYDYNYGFTVWAIGFRVLGVWVGGLGLGL